MNDDELNKLFSEAAQSQPSERAKKDAMNAAMAEYRAAYRSVADDSKSHKKLNRLQGFWKWLRPTVEQSTETRNRPMNPTTLPSHSFDFPNRKWQLAGISTVSVLFLAVLIANQQHSGLPTGPELLEESQPSVQSLVDTGSADARGAVLSDRVEADSVGLPEPAVESRQQFQVNEQISYELSERKLLKDESFAAAAPGAEQSLSRRAESGLVGLVAAPAMQAETQVPTGYQDQGRDQFTSVDENPVKRVAAEPTSTFSIDVDTASYSFVRRQLNGGVLPQKDAVRIEEIVNYFDYTYPQPASRDLPFSTFVNVVNSPWNTNNKLVHIGIQGYDIPTSEMPRSNLVFLLDVSGSMNSPDKLPLVKQSMELLLSQLNPDDTVAIAVYAGAAGTILEPTPVSERQKIFDALQRLQAGGSTAGGAGLKLAYQLAESSYRDDATNRIILATDGDFNVGISNQEELKGFIERKRDEGIYLSVLGFGQGNYQDDLMQALAQNGNGVAAYIDTLGEAQKVLVTEATSTLFPIAQDVKIQVEFNPATVSEYRLIGYETRHLENEDFNNDKVDAGDIGAGHSVTAIYEITPVGNGNGLLPESRYSSADATSAESLNNEYGFLSLRYKLPGEAHSKLISDPILIDSAETSERLPELARETAFASAVAGFAQLLKGGQYTGNWSYDDALSLAQANKGEDLYGYRTEFVQLIRKAKIADAL